MGGCDKERNAEMVTKLKVLTPCGYCTYGFRAGGLMRFSNIPPVYKDDRNRKYNGEEQNYNFTCHA